LNDIYSTILEQKDEIINGLLEIYSSVRDSKNNQAKIKKLQSLIGHQKAKKDALLDLYMDKAITKPEFTERNEALNVEVERLVGLLEGFEEEERLSADSVENLKALRKTLEEEFANADSFNAEMSNVLLDRIIVHKIDGSKHNLRLEIVLNIGKSFIVEYGNNDIISLHEIGISQAQVSRLEKGALNKIKRKF
jgi:DNA-directed RNA polymerase specialized sigma subunit